MSYYSFYETGTGIFKGGYYIGPHNEAQEVCPEGFSVYAGVVDKDRYKLDLETNLLVDYIPPPPDHGDSVEWSWDTVTRAWVGAPSAEARARDARSKRDALANAFAWRYERHQRELRLALPTTDSLEVLDAYMQALADVPAQPGFPDSIIWPQEP
jgi:hypothetical protein